jgi:uncharacterized protein (TIGR02444 family)
VQFSNAAHDGDLDLLPLDNPFWQFSLRVYAVPAAAAECLELQRLLAINVNLLLFCSWIAVSRRVGLGAVDIRSIEGEIDGWHTVAVLPLRKIREQIKLLPEMQHQEVQAFRRQVLADELQAEQIEQALIFNRAERLSMQQKSRAVRDIIAGNIDLLCGLSTISKPGGNPVSVSALIEVSLAVSEDTPNPSSGADI